MIWMEGVENDLGEQNENKWKLIINKSVHLQ
jgi:hypothetical protein